MENWKTALIRYFKAGAADVSEKKLGVELEHFILDGRTKEALPYTTEKGSISAGPDNKTIRSILSQLMAQYPDAEVIKDDDFLGFKVPAFTITIEPAAQLEISIAPISSVNCIGKVYSDFRSKLEAIAKEGGLDICTLGCMPESRVDKLQLIPKRRYEWMNEHFKKTGSGGMEMMRGTASTQVSIDYAGEEDFRNKLQAAYYYGPFLKLLMDNSPSFQGQSLNIRLKRTDIWRRTDPARCGILPGVFSPDYGFENYADFIGKMPPIFLKYGHEAELTGDKTVADIFSSRPMDEELLTHVLSMAFPDVRLKQYLEIRFADSAPLPFVLAYSALIKGLLYSERGLAYAGENIRSRKLTEKDIILAEDDIIRRGWDGQAYGLTVAKEAERILDLARREVSEDEQHYLDIMEKVIRYGGICNIPKEDKI